MNRPPLQPPRSAFSGEELEAYDRVVWRFTERVGREQSEDSPAGAHYGSYLQSPRMAALSCEFAMLGRDAPNHEGTYTHRWRELVDMVLCYGWGYHGFLGFHIEDAVAVGLPLESVEAVRDGRFDDLPPEDRLPVDFIRGVINGDVSDETYAAVEAEIGSRGLVEYAGFIMFLTMTVRLHQLFEIPGPTREDADAVIDGLRAGTISPPEYEEAALAASARYGGPA